MSTTNQVVEHVRAELLAPGDVLVRAPVMWMVTAPPVRGTVQGRPAVRIGVREIGKGRTGKFNIEVPPGHMMEALIPLPADGRRRIE